MKICTSIFLIAFFVGTLQLNAQNTYDINLYPTNRNQVCSGFNKAFSQKPKEVMFSVVRDGNKLYFQTNNKSWFNSLFQSSKDGIAIDVVNKNRYDCDVPSVEESQIKGELLEPVYARQLRSGLKPYGEGYFRTYVGDLKTSASSEALEYNILFLVNNNLCRYQTIYQLESYPWDLLDMGMYLDSLTYNSNQIKPGSTDAYLVKNKTLKFVIPFEKNKSEYTQDDIKPIYDSLRLTDFNIKSINIKAYSSVEGSLERNIELQEQRANSIVKALQSFQTPTIRTEVSSSENWVEFLNDIKSTKHADLGALSKKEIKSKLTGSLSNELEPILKNHRKAVLKLELEKIDKYKDMTADELLVKFNTAITQDELEEAKQIQNSIFEKLKDKEISPDFLRKMQIPNQAKFAKLLYKNSAIKYMMDVKQSLIVYNELKALEKLVPKDPEVKYNILSVKIKLWRYRALEINPSELLKEIKALNNYGIDNALISRMVVNYHIIKAENAMRKGAYKEKDASVDVINNNYKKFELSDFDYLSLAQFFAFYANTELSVDLLEDKVKSIQIDEDLLFYYINLTIADKELTKADDYRTMLYNAYNMNGKRFCRLFNSVSNGGVTFQLLENSYLRATYCENCMD